MKMNPTWVWRALVLVAVLALMWGISPAWTLWRTHEVQFEQLAHQRIAMQALQKEAQILQKKAVLPLAEALSQIKSIGAKWPGATTQALNGTTVQIQIKSVPADQLALAWNDIRKMTSASVVKADLEANGFNWSGTLVFQLAQQP